MGSSRLPGKVMLKLDGLHSIVHTIRRVKKARLVEDVVLATTKSPADDVLEEVARSEGISCYRGSEDDVLERVCEAHRYMQTDVIVQVTGDCPMIDPRVLDLGVREFLSADYDVVSNTWIEGYPQGIDVQAYRTELLNAVENSIADPKVREHVTLHFYRNPENYNIKHLRPSQEYFYPEIRTQLDYIEDYNFLSVLIPALRSKYKDNYGFEEIIEYLLIHPHLMEINKHCIETNLE